MGIASSSANPESRAMTLAKPRQIVTESRLAMALANAKLIVASAHIVIFSKSYCPFCVQVKTLFEQFGASFKAVELDLESDGSDLQGALNIWTGRRTVPNVFINGKHIGGCDDAMVLNSGGVDEQNFIDLWP